ncbi:MAG: IS110 family transposase [Geodermatophilaceae bacterium]
MTNQQHRVGGVDSHKDTIHVAVIGELGQPLVDQEFPTTRAGYRRAVAWLIGHGPLSAVGVEGTSSYGVGITTALTRAGIKVIEVNRTRPAERRKQGKSDRLDAYRAARSVLSGEATTDPRRASIEPLRALTVARRSALKAQQAAWRQIGALLINAPAHLRDRYRNLSDARLVAALSRTRAGQTNQAGEADTLYALRSLARRYRELADEMAELEQRMLARATAANPALLAIKGVGPVIGAQLLITAGDNPDRLRSSASFAALCGTAPIPVSSGRTDRHRLSRGGDRQANNALHHIVKNRMTNDPRTRTYRDGHVAKGWTKPAIYRALKRAVVREIFAALTGKCTVQQYADLRPARRAKNITLATAAAAFNVWPSRIGELELCRRRDDDFAAAYRTWLHAA